MSGLFAPGGGKLVQVVNMQDGAFVSGALLIPFDNTIPQITEGNEFMTLAITPKDVNNVLLIDVIAMFAGTSISPHLMALFQDAGANALAVASTVLAAIDFQMNLVLRHKMIAGTVASTTFRTRIGAGNPSRIDFNGVSNAGIYGGTEASSMTITELKP